MEQDVVSRLLSDVRGGDRQVLDSLIAAVYDELRRIAGSLMRGRLNGRTLQPTALVNEAWLRLADGPKEWENRAHFFGTAARAMRQVLVEEARRRSSKKRAGDARRVTFHDLDFAAEDPSIDLLALDEALSALAQINQRLTRLIDLRYFAGCSLEEAAEITGCSLATVKRDWAYSRAWLAERMNLSTARTLQ
jgi:RNA polymerase sigma factor (TIGR02999 family)